jgi:stage V sporulation protein B
MVFPIYTLLLDFSGAAVPSAISKIISSYKGEDKEQYALSYLKSSVKLMAIFGGVCALLMAGFCAVFSSWQGDINARYGYLLLSPAIFFVSIICCFRGYFQGLQNMKPTAVSQVIEQLIKLLVGLVAVYLLMPNVKAAVGGATAAITISELVAAAWLYLKFLRRRKGVGAMFSSREYELKVKTILRTALPITLTGIMLPISHVIDSFLTVNIINSYRSDATALYGLYSGAVHTVINLPVAVCYALATVSIPAVSSAKNHLEGKKLGGKTLLLTLYLAFPMMLIILFGAPIITKILFGNFNQEETQTVINLMRLSSPCVVLTSMVQTAGAVLIGLGKSYVPLFSLLFGVGVKTIMTIILLSNPSVNIYGSAIAAIACYFIVCLVNLIMIIKSKVANEGARALRREYAS